MRFKTPLPDGVFTATLTPLNQDLSVDFALLYTHCDWLLKNGSNGIALLGTTGEANSFTIKERHEIIDQTIKQGIPANQIMVGTGCCAYADTIKLTKQAIQAGIDSILLLPPFYYKQIDEDGLLNYFHLVINGVQASNLKIYLYHFPKMAGVGYSTSLVLRLIEEFPGVIVGMKDSTGDWNHMQEILKVIPGFKFYAGTEKYLLDTLSAGGVGCISATANVTSMLAGQVYQLWKDRAAPDELNEHLKAVRSAFDGLPFTGALKSIISKWTGMDNWSNLRPPNSLLSRESLDQLEQKLINLNFTIG